VGGTAADVWLQGFIETEIPEGMSLWNMATQVADKLNGAFGGAIPDRMGIHVGGFDEENGVRGPALYHVHNGHYHVEFRSGKIVEVPDEAPPIREFRAHEDFPPSIFKEDDPPRMLRNGAFGIFALHQSTSDAFQIIREATGLIFPYPPNLETRGEYLRYWINTMKEIFRLSNARPRVVSQPPTVGDAGVGGPVTVLTISESGIENFYAR